MYSFEYAAWSSTCALVVGMNSKVLERPSVSSVLSTSVLCEHHIAHCYISSMNKLPNSAECHNSWTSNNSNHSNELELLEIYSVNTK